MIQHRPPDGIDPRLLDPADRAACAEATAQFDWSRAGAELQAARLPDAALESLRTYGLLPARRPGLLGPRGVDDAVGAEALRELAARRR